MRLKAREDMIYAGNEVQAGFIFDAPDADAQRLINQDLAVPFNLEDPSTLGEEPPVGVGPLKPQKTPWPEEEPDKPKPHPAVQPAAEPEPTSWKKKSPK